MDAASPRKPALGFIFVTLVLMVLGFSIIIPVLPPLVTQFEGGSVAAGSKYYGLLLVVFAIMQFIASPILGSLSDRFGRRRVILIALAGSAIDYVIMGLAPSMLWMFAARMISGATAGSLAACNAYIADVTPPEKRAQGFGMVGAAFGVGFVVGPLIGGFFGQFSIRLPFFVAAGCVATNWLYGAFVLPESLRAENRRPFSWMRANPVGSLLALRRFRGVFDLACMQFIFYFANSMLQSIWVLYTGYRYHWGAFVVGLSLTFIGVMAVVVQGGHGQADHRADRRAQGPRGRPGDFLGRHGRLRPGDPGMDDLLHRPDRRLGRDRRPGGAGAGDQARAAERAGRRPGFADRPAEPGRNHRAPFCHLELRGLYRPGHPLAPSRHRVFRGLAAPGLCAPARLSLVPAG